MERHRRKRRAVEAVSSKQTRQKRLALADVTKEVERKHNVQASVEVPLYRKSGRATTPPPTRKHVDLARTRGQTVAPSPSMELETSPLSRQAAILTRSDAAKRVASDELRQIPRTSVPCGSESDKSTEHVSLSTPTSTEEELITFERRFRSAHADSVFRETELKSGPRVSSPPRERRREERVLQQPRSDRSQHDAVARRRNTRSAKSFIGRKGNRESAASASPLHARLLGAPASRLRSSGVSIQSPAPAMNLEHEQIHFWEQVDREELLVEDLTPSTTTGDQGGTFGAVDC
jgi:hypothetical protein